MVHLIGIAAIMLVAGQDANAGESQSAEHFLHQWARAWEESDIDRMMDFYDTSEKTLAVESRGILRRGPAEIREMYEDAFGELIFDRVRLVMITKGQHDSVAWATCRYIADARLKSDGSRHVFDVHGSFVMKRQGDSWKITLEHFSPIANIPRVRPGAAD